MEDLRKHVLKKWLTDTCLFKDFTLNAMPHDASLRRYFRVQHAGESYVAMVAPTEREDCKPFVAISNTLREQGLLSPEIIHSNIPQGFLLITDFGDRQLLKQLNVVNAETLYGNALDALAVLQSCRVVLGWKIPPFTINFMYQELMLFKEWFLQTFLEIELTHATEKMLTTFFNHLTHSAASQPQVFMHRDYHSANLMVLPRNEVGILDFQDAFIGPVTYDLVSLLRDSYIDWPEALVNKLAVEYKERLKISVTNEEFLLWFDLMGLQRHMKAILTFVRKYERDGNDQYLQHIPRTLNYISTVSKRHPEGKDFYSFLQTVVWPSYEIAGVTCVE